MDVEVTDKFMNYKKRLGLNFDIDDGEFEST